MPSWQIPNLRSWFSRKDTVPQPADMAMAAPSWASQFLNPQEITPYNAWLLYKSCAPFAKVVNLIADAVASLVPLVEVDGKAVDGHPVGQFMARPGFNRTRRRLIKELTVQYLVTGTAYLHVIGDTNRPPLAFYQLKSRFISHFPGQDSWPDTYAYSEGTRNIRFQRNDSPRDPRYVDETTGLAELVPIYDMDGDYRGVGLPRLNAIKHDVELRLKGIEHNNNVMDNGARLSGILSFKNDLTSEQQQDLLGQFRSAATGAANAGKIMVTAGGESEFLQLSQSVKDMDFANLIRIVEDSIITAYNVPVTLYRPEAQTNNNYQTAWTLFYDEAVLPTFQIVYSSLAHLFSERLGENLEIVHDSLTNAVLAQAASARARELFNAHIISRNEARTIVGYEPALGGDTIYGPMGEVPVAEDFFTGNEEDLSAEAFQRERSGRLPGSTIDPATGSPALPPPDTKPDAKPADVAAAKRLLVVK